jgi:hypothetical protein
MNQPKRLRLVGSNAARSLLNAGRQDEPSPSLVPAVMGTLGVATASAVMAPSLGAKLVVALRHAVLSKVGVGVVAVATASGGGYVAGRMHERLLQAETTQQTVTAQPEVAPRPHERVTLAIPPPPPLPTVTAEVASPLPPRLDPPVRSRAVAVAPQPTVQATASAKPSILDELDGIRHVCALVLAGSGQQALDALDAYAVSHPSGTFDEEALALRVRASRLAGDVLGAERSLRSLETRFPSSVHLAGLKSY